MGQRILNEVKKTKFYALSHVIDQALYGCDEPKTTGTTAYIAFPAQINIGGDGAQFMGRNGSSVDLRKALREIQLELERLAFLEVTS